MTEKTIFNGRIVIASFSGVYRNFWVFTHFDFKQPVKSIHLNNQHKCFSGWRKIWSSNFFDIEFFAKTEIFQLLLEREYLVEYKPTSKLHTLNTLHWFNYLFIIFEFRCMMKFNQIRSRSWFAKKHFV